MKFDTTGLLEPQKEHSQFLNESLEVNGVSWDGSVTGAGKMYIASAIARARKKKFAVVAPKLIIPTWLEVMKKFKVSPEFIINYEKLARGNTPYYRYKTRGMKGIPHFLRGEFRIPKDVELYFDESHRTKGVDSLNSGLPYAATIQGIKTHFMSATQATTPLDMRAFGFATGLHKGMQPVESENWGMRQFKAFCEEAGAEYVGKWGAMFFDSDNPIAVQKMKRIHDTLFNEKKIGSRLTREDFAGIFPDVQRVVEAYDMGTNSDKIQEVYDEMDRELDELERKCESYKDHILAIITKARRKAEMLKVPTMVEMACDLYDEGMSVVLFVNYTDTIVALYERLSKIYGADKVGKIYGEQTFTEKFRDIKDFNEDRKRFMIANLAAGGEAINLHDLIGNHGRASIINPSYSAIKVIQCGGRTDRAYAKTDVYMRYLLAARTIEERVCHRFQIKKDFIELLNDGDLIPSERIFKFAHGMNI